MTALPLPWETGAVSSEYPPLDEPPLALQVHTLQEFLALKVPQREPVLPPWFYRGDLAMVYGPRGIGKTFFALNVAFAVASGESFLGWTAPRAATVLYVDGEMPAATLQTRVGAIARAATRGNENVALRFLAGDLQEHGIPDLATPRGQTVIEDHLGGVELIVLDNLSALCRTGKENEGESWLPIQEWALSLRRRGIAGLFVHHAGKSGQQRGTSRREDVLDTVIALRRPSNYSPTEGARFEVHFEKARGLHGPELEPFEATLMAGPDDRPVWTKRSMEEGRFERCVALLADGATPTEAAKDLGVSRATAYRYQQQAREKGILGEPAAAGRKSQT